MFLTKVKPSIYLRCCLSVEEEIVSVATEQIVESAPVLDEVAADEREEKIYDSTLSDVDVIEYDVVETPSLVENVIALEERAEKDEVLHDTELHEHTFVRTESTLEANKKESPLTVEDVVALTTEVSYESTNRDYVIIEPQVEEMESLNLAKVEHGETHEKAEHIQNTVIFEAAFPRIVYPFRRSTVEVPADEYPESDSEAESEDDIFAEGEKEESEEDAAPVNDESLVAVTILQPVSHTPTFFYTGGEDEQPVEDIQLPTKVELSSDDDVSANESDVDTLKSSDNDDEDYIHVEFVEPVESEPTEPNADTILSSKHHIDISKQPDVISLRLGLAEPTERIDEEGSEGSSPETVDDAVEEVTTPKYVITPKTSSEDESVEQFDPRYVDVFVKNVTSDDEVNISDKEPTSTVCIKPDDTEEEVKPVIVEPVESLPVDEKEDFEEPDGILNKEPVLQEDETESLPEEELTTSEQSDEEYPAAEEPSAQPDSPRFTTSFDVTVIKPNDPYTVSLKYVDVTSAPLQTQEVNFTKSEDETDASSEISEESPDERPDLMLPSDEEILKVKRSLEDLDRELKLNESVILQSPIKKIPDEETLRESVVVDTIIEPKIAQNEESLPEEYMKIDDVVDIAQQKYHMVDVVSSQPHVIQAARAEETKKVEPQEEIKQVFSQRMKGKHLSQVFSDEEELQSDIITGRYTPVVSTVELGVQEKFAISDDEESTSSGINDTEDEEEHKEDEENEDDKESKDDPMQEAVVEKPKENRPYDEGYSSPKEIKTFDIHAITQKPIEFESPSEIKPVIYDYKEPMSPTKGNHSHLFVLFQR